jgi:enoyl-[acyl-carrier protein] reductase I
VSVGTWPPTWDIFAKLIERGKLDRSRTMRDGRLLEFERIYPLDAAFDTLEDVPEDIRTNKRYRDVGDYTIAGLVSQWRRDFGDESLDIVVHSLANGPEVRNPLIETSRSGYLAALSVSAYSMVAMVRHLAPLMSSDGAFMALSYLAGQRVIPGYGGGMSSAKAALESDVRVLAHEAGRRYGLRVNCISAGPLASRAASAIGEIDRMVDYVARNTPLAASLRSDEVGQAAAFLCSSLASGITGTVLYVDKGYHAMGMPVDQSLL